MRKIWYLKQEKGQKTKTAKVFLYEKDGHVEGRLDLSAFGDCKEEERKTLLLHMKEISGKDVGKISLEEGTVSYESFFQGKGKLKEELADRLRVLKGKVLLSVTAGQERYLSEGWTDEETVSERAERKREIEEAKRGGEIEEAEQENKEETEKENKEETEKENKEETEKENKGETEKENEGKAERKDGERVQETEELEAEELLEEKREEKRIVQLSVLEDELLFRSYVHNSFLLHGYYNYGHVMIDESGAEPRLGVPGNYYEREHMVAEMFGFPVFETAREGEKITNGTFGYFYTKG